MSILGKLWAIVYDKHMGLLEKDAALEQYRGQGEDATIYTMQDNLHAQAGDGLDTQSLLDLLAQRERESGK